MARKIGNVVAVLIVLVPLWCWFLAERQYALQTARTQGALTMLAEMHLRFARESCEGMEGYLNDVRQLAALNPNEHLLATYRRLCEEEELRSHRR